MVRRPLVAGALLIVTMAATSLVAGEVRLVLEPDHSKIEFKLKATLHDVEGHLGLRSGELRFDPVEGTLGGEIVVDARSGDTGNVRRDRKMHGKVLESERYPTIVFLPSGYRGTLEAEGKSRIDVLGELRVHGGTHEIQVPVDVDMRDGQVAGKASFAVPYVDWGLSDPSAFVLRVGKSVDVRVEVKGVLDPEKSQP